jgi:hypothetical protein
MIKITLKNGVEVAVDNIKEARALLGLAEKKSTPVDVQKVVDAKTRQHRYCRRYYKKHREEIRAKQQERRRKAKIGSEISAI